MAFAHGKGAKVYAGGFDLSSYLNEVAPSQTADVAETTVFGLDSKSYIAGLNDGTLSLSGFFDGDTDASHDRLQAALGVDTVLSVAPHGDSVGGVSFALLGIGNSYEIPSSLSGAVTISGGFQGKTGLMGATILHDLSAEASNADGTGQDNGSQTTEGGRGFLHVSAIAGTPTIRIEHSSDDISYATLITFSPTAVGGSTDVATGTVERYVRASWTAAASVTFHLSFHRA